MKYTVEYLEQKIRIVEPNLHVWNSYIDVSNDSFYLRDTDPDFNLMSWNIELKRREMSFFADTDISEEIVEFVIKDMLQQADKIEGKVCMTERAWEALQSAIKNPRDSFKHEKAEHQVF